MPMDDRELEIIKKIEQLTNRSIPQVDKVRFENFDGISECKFTKHIVGYEKRAGHIVALGLSNLNLTSIPEAVGSLNHLEELDLIGNNLTTIPASIGNLNSLKFLHLFKNRILHLPQSIGELSLLEYLNLGMNSLSKIPDSIGNLSNLIYLSLHQNKITILPESIGNLRELKSLNLDNNLIEKLPFGFGSLENLEILRISGNQLKKIPNSFATLQNLRKLYMSQNKISSITSKIDNLINLEYVNLRYNHLEKTPDSLTKLNSIKMIDLRNNNFPSKESSILKLSNSINVCVDSYVLKHESRPLNCLDLEDIGEIEIKSGQIAIKDPYLEINQDTTYRVRKGIWKILLVNCSTYDVPISNKGLNSVILVHEKYVNMLMIPEDWQIQLAKIEGNQIGIYDAGLLPENSKTQGQLERKAEFDSFYKQNRKLNKYSDLSLFNHSGIVIKLINNDIRVPIFSYKNNRGFVITFWIDFTEGDLFEILNYRTMDES
ncbi:MAG: hypothetical protein GF364_02990 [Candidatus Lokiarchaeota archaeon]|nr:hypothetical protein [Candidatus Lokiarchaeota archaeon]